MRSKEDLRIFLIQEKLKMKIRNIIKIKKPRKHKKNQSKKDLLRKMRLIKN